MPRPADLPQPAELHNRVATVVQQRQREVAEVNETLKRLQGEVGAAFGAQLGRGCGAGAGCRLASDCSGSHLPGCAHPAYLPRVLNYAPFTHSPATLKNPAQLSSHQGSLSALRRQLAAAQDEQGKLAEQLRTGLATAGEAAAAGDQISTQVG